MQKIWKSHDTSEYLSKLLHVCWAKRKFKLKHFEEYEENDKCLMIINKYYLLIFNLYTTIHKETNTNIHSNENVQCAIQKHKKKKNDEKLV